MSSRNAIILYNTLKNGPKRKSLSVVRIHAIKMVNELGREWNVNSYEELKGQYIYAVYSLTCPISFSTKAILFYLCSYLINLGKIQKERMHQYRMMSTDGRNKMEYYRHSNVYKCLYGKNSKLTLLEFFRK